MKTDLEEVLNEVCKYYEITEADLIERNRHEDIVEARHIYMALAVEFSYPRYTLAKIARRIERDHATVIYARNKMENPTKTENYAMEEIRMKLRSQVENPYIEMVYNLGRAMYNINIEMNVMIKDIDGHFSHIPEDKKDIEIKGRNGKKMTIPYIEKTY